MSGARREEGGERGASAAAQAGKLLCVSETIFPAASSHCLSLVYQGFAPGGAMPPAPRDRLPGEGLVDLRGSGAARPGDAAPTLPRTRPRDAAR